MGKPIEYKLDEQTATAELERLADIMDLDLGVDESLDEKDRKQAKQSLDTIIKSIRKGDSLITDDGELVFTPARSNGVGAITFQEPTGATLLASDKFSDKQKLHKMYAMIAEMTGVEPATFSRLKKSDLNVVMAVGGLFLG